jgi:3-hydroxyacyl-CoA dehydrogenase
VAGAVDYEKRGDVAVLRVDNPPVNALSHGVRRGLLDGMARAGRDRAQAVVIVGRGRTFPAGADIREFGKLLEAPSLHEVLDAIEASDAPVVAAIHGTALGGGLETALACDYRVAVASAKVGLPEVSLGLLPGAGGTQRLPRLVGAREALRMMTTGEHVGAAHAREAGLVDEVVDGDVERAGIAFAEKLAREGAGKRRVRDTRGRLDPDDAERAAIVADARSAVQSRRQGQEAPERIVRAVEAAFDAPDFDQGQRAERALFDECMRSPQRAAMIHVFFAEREAQRIPDVPRETPRAPIERVGVIGAGTMGRGIAMAFADTEHPVVLIETDDDRLDDALDAIRRTYASSVKKGRLPPEEVGRRMDRIVGATDIAELGDVSLAIEAVYEDLDSKKKTFAELDAVTPPDALLATNTSTLDVDAIASATSRPASVVGMHFFSPAHVMRLLEVVRGRETGKQALATAMDLGRRLGKIAVCAGNCDGFIGNRMLAGYGREAAFLLEEGATPAQVDRALVAFGMPMGPFQMGDMAGLDVGWRIRKQRGRPEGTRYSDLADELCERGRFGQKTGAGWYRYEPGARTPEPDPEVIALIEAASNERGIARREITDAEIVDRCILPLVNEGARILEEGIAIRSGDIDVVWVYGYGFPVWRGGPMFWADQQGLAAMHARIEALHAQHGPLWEPAPLLARLAREGRRFTDFGRE